MESIAYFLKVTYWCHVHLLRGIFGHNPKVGEVWEFTGEPIHNERFNVLVEKTTFLFVYYKYEDGNGTTYRTNKFEFKICYRPSKVSH